MPAGARELQGLFSLVKSLFPPSQILQLYLLVLGGCASTTLSYRVNRMWQAQRDDCAGPLAADRRAECGHDDESALDLGILILVNNRRRGSAQGIEPVNLGPASTRNAA